MCWYITLCSILPAGSAPGGGLCYTLPCVLFESGLNFSLRLDELNMRQSIVKIAGLSLVAASLACGLIPTQPVEESTPGGETAAGPTPTEAEDTQSEPVEGGLATATPAMEATAPPLMSAWPLSSDLYYLNDAGQIWRQPKRGDESAASAITRLDLEVRDFAIAPGGQWLLYRTDDTVSMASLDGLSGQIVADGVGAVETDETENTLAWSPGGEKLAFATGSGFEVIVPGGGVDYMPLVFSAEEDALRGLGWSLDGGWLLAWRADQTAALYSVGAALSLWVELGAINGYAWLPDGRLAFAPAEGGLALVAPDDLGTRVFMITQERAVTLPFLRPDDTLVFFVHEDGVDGPGFLHSGDPSDASFGAESGVPVETAGLSWNSDGTRLVHRVGETDAVELIDPLTGSRATFDASGSPLHFDWGDPPILAVTGVELPADLYFLAPQAGITQVWLLPDNGSEPLPVTEAVEDVVDFDVSADGMQVAYTSGHAIYREVQSVPGGPEMIAELNDSGPAWGTPSFSPSGRQLAYANGGIWIADLDTGVTRRLVADSLPQSGGSERLVEVYGQPRWSPDEAWLLTTVGFYEGSDQALIPLAGDPITPIDLNLYGAGAEWLPDGRALVYGSGGAYVQPQLSVVDPPAVEDAQATVTRLLSLPVIDVQPRADNWVAFLRLSAPPVSGPTSIQLNSVQSGGGSPQAETGWFVLTSPVLAPDAVTLAGLVGEQLDESGQFAGQLVILNTASGQRVQIEGATGARAMLWRE